MKTGPTDALIVFIAALALSAPATAMHDATPLPVDPSRPMSPVILDPGHGGEDLGAVVNGVREKDVVLAVARALKNRLKDVPIILTREDDRYVPLDRRMVESVDWNGAVFVSLHLNKVHSHKLAGAIVYSYGPDRSGVKPSRKHPAVPPMPAPPRIASRESALLARSFEKVLRADGFRVETSKSDYYVLKNPTQPSVLIELGYLSNPEEAARLADPAYQEKIAKSLSRAIEAYASERALRDSSLATSLWPIPRL